MEKKSKPKQTQQMTDLTSSLKGKSALELLEQAQEFENSFEFDQANICYMEAMNSFPNDPLIMDPYAEFLIQQGDIPYAMKLLKKSIDIAPTQNGLKYCSLAELLSGAEAVKVYEKGIEVLISSNFEANK